MGVSFVISTLCSLWAQPDKRNFGPIKGYCFTIFLPPLT